jgi:hypothetical protein
MPDPIFDHIANAHSPTQCAPVRFAAADLNADGFLDRVNVNSGWGESLTFVRLAEIFTTGFPARAKNRGD